MDHCQHAGRWETDCRHFWIEHQLWTTDAPRSELLNACKTDYDCILDVLDVRHSDDIYEQLLLCERWTGKNQRHCASHAMQRWRYAIRKKEDFPILLSLRNPFAEEIGYWLAMTQYCDNIGKCEGSGDAYQICVDYTVKLRQGSLICTAPLNTPVKPKYYQKKAP